MRQQIIHVGWKRRAAGFGLGVLAGALNVFSGFRRKSASTSPAVLILEPYGMGDVISLEPLIRALKERRFEIRISARAAWRPLFHGHAISRWLDGELPWSSYESGRKYRWTSLANDSFKEYLRQLRQLGSGAIGIDPRGDVRSVLLLHVAGCPKVLTLRNYLGTDLRMSPFAGSVLDYPDHFKRWQVSLLFLDALGIPSHSVQHAPPRLHQFSIAAAATRRIGLVPIAPWSGKLWGCDNWTKLISRLRAQRLGPVGFCGPGQTALAAAQLGGAAPVEECTDVPAWAERLGQCQAVISVDTGPMHLADALGLPVIALFGQGKLPLWAPSGPNSRVISHQDDPDFFLCHPIDENARLGRKFMARISVEEVMNAVSDLEKSNR